MKSVLRRILPGSIWAVLRQGNARVNAARAQLLAKAAPFRLLGYVFSAHFYADFAGFVAGAALFDTRNRAEGPNLAKLRRNVHRLEKGLSFADRRSVFALDYIQDTVANYGKLCRRADRDSLSEFDWARDVLTDYFALTESDDSRYQAASAAFEQLSVQTEGAAQEVPYTYLNQSTPEDAASLMKLLHQRKSVRDFEPVPVPQEVLDRALEAASSAPSSCNRQPYRYYILNTPETAQQAARVSVGTGGWAQNIQCLAVVVGDTSNFPNAVNRHSIYVDSTLSIMPFALALEAQGYSTCLINWADDAPRRKKITQILGLAPHQRVILSIAVGKAAPEARVPYSKKKFTKEIGSHV